jgi:ABC-type oligopeptide transport system ATPase subunit
MSYIFISHDLSVVKYISDRVMVMHHGSVVEMADSDELYRNRGPRSIPTPRRCWRRSRAAA